MSKIIEEIYESWANSYGYPTKKNKEAMMAFVNMVLKKLEVVLPADPVEVVEEVVEEVIEEEPVEEVIEEEPVEEPVVTDELVIEEPVE